MLRIRGGLIPTYAALIADVETTTGYDAAGNGAESGRRFAAAGTSPACSITYRTEMEISCAQAARISTIGSKANARNGLRRPLGFICLAIAEIASGSALCQELNVHWMVKTDVVQEGTLHAGNAETFEEIRRRLQTLRPESPIVKLRLYSRTPPANPNEIFGDATLDRWKRWTERLGPVSEYLPFARYVKIGGNSVLESRQTANKPALREVISGKDPCLSANSNGGAKRWRIVDFSIRPRLDGKLVGVVFLRLEEPMLYEKVVLAFREVQERLNDLRLNQLMVVVRGDSRFGGESRFSGIDFFDDDLHTQTQALIKSRTAYYCDDNQAPVCR